MKTRRERLLSAMSEAEKAGGGIHTTRELAFMIGERHTPAFTKFLAECVKSGILRRVSSGLFESTLTPPSADKAISQVINKLRSGVINYISLESELSHTGHISQIPMGHVTVMTKGRSGTFETPYGTIEFIHTKKPLSSIGPHLYFDPGMSMYRADTTLAIADLKACNRNTQMLESI
ncbi:hypothetical protein K0504_10375 [Neiella marina]|uniref:Uncharacterized protein n=1 Tax=Neiella holothuriorum TaxID=2870530 RepID=A0ABS7EGH1_9GAMM|nr:hypothetical protein [Neiella holothuriorum]MBW8191442.1 hypothetical protein [Neiella holothuriorum]